MTEKPEPSAFEKFQELVGKLVKVPKGEVDREGKKEQGKTEKPES